MKKIITISALVLTPLCFAQGGKRDGGHHRPPPHVIEKFDTDGDGQLNESEREAAKAHLKEMMEERREFRQSFDYDGDGELNETEKADFEAAREQKIIERFDEDGDGQLNADEQAKADKAKERMKKMHSKRGKKGPKGRKGGL